MFRHSGNENVWDLGPGRKITQREDERHAPFSSLLDKYVERQ